MGNVMKDMFNTMENNMEDSYILPAHTQRILTEVLQEHDNTIKESTISHTLQEVDQHGFIIEERIHEGANHNHLTSFQFFSASMFVFFALTSGMGIGSSLIDDRKNKTLKRIHAFPVKKSEYLLGKIIGNGIIAILQAISIIFITHVVFDVHWGNQYLGITLILFLLLFIAYGLGIILSMMMHSSGALTATLTIILWFMAFVSGGFTGYPILGFVSKLTVNHWAFDSLATLMAGGKLQDIILHFVVLFGVAMVLWSISLALYDRRASHE